MGRQMQGKNKTAPQICPQQTPLAAMVIGSTYSEV